MHACMISGVASAPENGKAAAGFNEIKPEMIMHSGTIKLKRGIHNKSFGWHGKEVGTK